MMKGAIKLELARLRDMTHVEWEYWEADLVPGGFWARMAPDAVIALEAAVLQCYRVSSGPDFILVTQVADMPAYHALVHRALTAQANVRNVRTFFSIHRSKFNTGIVLGKSHA